MRAGLVPIDPQPIGDYRLLKTRVLRPGESPLLGHKAVYRPGVDDLPELKPGYVRLSVMPRRADDLTPGAAARAAGIPLDELGNVTVVGSRIYVDTKLDHALVAKDGLSSLGPVKIARSKTIEYGYQWIRFQVGRNHGLTIGQLRKTLARAGISAVGRITIRNTFTLIGLRDDMLPKAEAHFADVKLNGVMVRPHRCLPGEIKSSPEFRPRG